MSAIAGIWDRHAQRSPEALAGAVDVMANAMRARGPDGGDSWCDAAAGLALAYRQLRVADRFPPVSQPLASSCGRYMFSGEGEVYNADELIPALRAAGRPMTVTSDAHVMVEAIAAWGMAAALRRLNAMFAAALWDRERRELCLFRDRIGTRPLYWTEAGGLFLFASELKALRASADFTPALDRDAVAGFLRRRCIPWPHTIYRGVRTLDPGCILSVEAGATPNIQPYWTLEEVVRAGQANRFAGSDVEATEQLDRLLRDAVARRIGKTSVGTFLSGGVDSSTVLTMLHAVAPGRAHGFTIGFQESAFNEADHAGAVARHIGAAHDVLRLSPDHARELIPQLPDIYDEPMADVSQIPTFFLAKLARGSVAAAFTGDGGDEFFSGYEQYLQAADLRRLIQRLPLPTRYLAEMAVRAMPPLIRNRLPAALPTALRPTHYAEKLGLLVGLLTGDADDQYRMINSYWPDPEGLVIGGREPVRTAEDRRFKALMPDPIERMKYAITLTTTPNGALTKVDRATSAAGLHMRMPLLDPRVVDFSWSMPAHMKLRGPTNKWLLRQVLYRYVPPELLVRPKMGFNVPIGHWLRGPLRDWAESLLDAKRLDAEGVFRPEPIRNRWREHLEERRNWAGPLWVVLMFQAWKERWLP